MRHRFTRDQYDAFVAVDDLGYEALRHDRARAVVADGLHDDIAIGVVLTDAKYRCAAHPIEGLQNDVFVLVDEFAQQLRVARDQRRHDEIGELCDRQLFVVVAQCARAVEDERTLRLRRFEKVGGIHILHVEWRVLAHQNGCERLQRPHRGRSDLEPVVIVCGDGQRAHRTERLFSIPEEVALLQCEQRVTTIVQRAHHRHAGIFVRLERSEGVEDKREFHGRRGGMRERHRTANSGTSPQRRQSPRVR